MSTFMDKMKEIHIKSQEFRPIVGTTYEIGSKGTVLNFVGKEVQPFTKKKPTPGSRPRLLVNLSVGGKTVNKIVSRLVCTAWHDNPNNLAEVDHWSGETLDNDYRNLSWMSREDNIAKARADGTYYKLSEGKQGMLMDMHNAGETNTYIGEFLGINRGTVASYIKRLK